MALSKKWKRFGKNTGQAFQNFGKAVAKTAKVAFTDEPNTKDGEGHTELRNAWAKTGKGFGEAGKSLGKAAQGTAQKVIGVEQPDEEENAEQREVVEAKVEEKKENE